jgi:hypothetical protein
MRTSDSPASSVAAQPRTDIRHTLTRVAWWSILLGLLIEALLLVIRLDILPQLQPVAEALGRVTWSLLVCMGLGVGKLLSEDKPFWVGLAGLISAPLAFTAAQAVQRTVTELATSIEAAPITPALIAVGALRGVEYLCLGAILAILAQRKKRPGYYLAAGLIVGLVFGAILLLVTPAAIGSIAALLAWVVNELLFPMGCALVLYGAGVISKAVPAQPGTEAAA